MVLVVPCASVVSRGSSSVPVQPQTWLVAIRNKPVSVIVSVPGLKLKLDRFTSVHRLSFFPNQMLKLQATEKVSEIKYCCNQMVGFMFITKLCEV